MRIVVALLTVASIGNSVSVVILLRIIRIETTRPQPGTSDE